MATLCLLLWHFCAAPGNDPSGNVFNMPVASGSFHPGALLNPTRSHLAPLSSITSSLLRGLGPPLLPFSGRHYLLYLKGLPPK